MNGKRWELQAATGQNFNCLIDTVRQSLGLPFSHALLDSVRNDLAKEFPVSRGEFQVRTTAGPLAGNPERARTCAQEVDFSLLREVSSATHSAW